MEYDYFEGRPQDVVREHRRRINMQIHERFRVRDNFDPLAMTVSEFERMYRMPQHVAVELCNIIQPYIPPHRSPQHTSLIRKVLVVLSYLASGSYQRIVGRSIDCAVSQTSVSRFVHEIVMALNHPEVLTRFIRFPLTHEERAPIIRRNARLGMERTLGFIDCFLLRLTYLPHDHERQAFFTRKGWTGLNNQIICDADLNIINVDARYPGSVNDFTVWTNSAARPVVEQAYWEDRCWLLGDSGYATAPWLHIPLIHAAEGTPEYYYTKLHMHCRNCVERCIGLLKARWRVLCIDRCINYRCPAFAGCIVNAWCVLHNFCNSKRVGILQPLIENDEPNWPDYNDPNLNIHERGLAELNYLVNYAYERRNVIVNAM